MLVFINESTQINDSLNWIFLVHIRSRLTYLKSHLLNLESASILWHVSDALCECLSGWDFEVCLCKQTAVYFQQYVRTNVWVFSFMLELQRHFQLDLDKENLKKNGGCGAIFSVHMSRCLGRIRFPFSFNSSSILVFSGSEWRKH